ncbi:MAG TPA: 4-hydroxy-3-methylbut-2-enyl diphosphate reductase [Bacteroidetes bacterium]|nr:4-hydroxy-3-methylbut-2-enyl diphosphate reductase [Bacteroidota bacterium]
MQIDIDTGCGFCSGVVRAVALAEEHLKNHGTLYCLGELIHNAQERKRLEDLGMQHIEKHDMQQLPRGSHILIRAHGEPPSTFELARQRGYRLIDATCPVVKRLQWKVKIASDLAVEKEGQVIIIGKKKHAEIRGLTGHAGNRALVVEDESDLTNVQPGIPAVIYSQTTENPGHFAELAAQIEQIVHSGNPDAEVQINPTICRQMSGREPRLKAFAGSHDVILFVSDPMSSNGRMLYQSALSANRNTHFIEHAGEIQSAWFRNARSVGISGATSTPGWLLREVATRVEILTRENGSSG